MYLVGTTQSVEKIGLLVNPQISWMVEGNCWYSQLPLTPSLFLGVGTTWWRTERYNCSRYPITSDKTESEVLGCRPSPFQRFNVTCGTGTVAVRSTIFYVEPSTAREDLAQIQRSSEARIRLIVTTIETEQAIEREIIVTSTTQPDDPPLHAGCCLSTSLTFTNQLNGLKHPMVFGILIELRNSPNLDLRFQTRE
ncbi:hypothetical protein C8R44DRAFT_746473 [Mycena epipterygia]|nr:hypothetical protein C8R44DRAFT_746473 [Mycena epipterygia]